MKNKALIRSRDRFLVFGSPSIGEDEINEVVDSLKAGWLGTGPKVQQFEEAFKVYKKAPFAIALNSCTAALHLSMLATGIGPGDEVITTAMTFCATINAIIHSGATPVLVDCDKDTHCIDPEQIVSKISKKTKAILPVHFAGHPCDMDKIMQIANKHKLKVIEDCAHAIETEYNGKPIGTFGDFGCFSFYVTKNVVTGEGGMVVAKQKKDADMIKVLGLHGMSQDAWKRFSDDGYKHYKVVHPGFKYNMMDIQAAIGIHQLKRVEENWKRREKIWKKYYNSLKDTPLILPTSVTENMRHAYHLFPVLVDKAKTGIDRDDFLLAMHKNNIGLGVHYQSIPEHPFYREHFKWRTQDYPNACFIGQQTVSLPLSPKMDDNDVDDVIRAVKKVLGL